MPFHFWLSDAYAVAPITICVLLSAVISDLGVHAIARIYWPAFSGVFASDAPSLRALLVGVGVLTCLVGATMTFLQRDLKRMLAFLTISHVGVFICGIGLLTARGLAGATLYVIGDGFRQGGALPCVGILLYRLGDGDELRLHGRGRGAPVAAIVFFAGSFLIAGLPPFGSFLGWTLLVRSAGDVGYGWLPPVLALGSVVTGGTLLRASARMFLGWGDAQDPLLSAEPPPLEDEPQQAESRASPPLLFGPALALLAAALAFSFAQGLAERATAWAVRLEDRPAHAAEVLAGKLPAPTAPVPVHAGILPYAYAIGSTLLAVGFALFGLYRRRLPALARRLRRPRARAAGRGAEGPAQRDRRRLRRVADVRRGRARRAAGPTCSLGDLERFDLAVDRELLERTRLDLPHALARQTQLASDRLERGRITVAVQPVAPLQHLLLAVRKLARPPGAGPPARG